MVYRDDPSGRQELADLKRRIAALETQSPLRSSSITSGRLRVGGTAILLVDSDGGIVIQGKLNGNGTLEWTGPVNLKGLTTITGDTTIDGLTKLLKTLTVAAPGKIVVEGSNAMTLGVGAFGLPGVGFASGGGVSGYTGGAFLHGGSNTVGCIANSTVATLSGGINNYITASATKVSVSGPFETTGIVNLNNLPTVSATGKTPNLWVDSAGKLWKLT